jgi:hypothetical protein
VNVATVVAALVVLALAVGATLRRGGPRDAAGVLRLLALLFAVVAVAATVRTTLDDSGAFALWGLGLPALATLAPVVAARSRFGVAVTWTVALFLLLWSLLLALGGGLVLLPAALAEIAAAVAQRRAAAVSAGAPGRRGTPT